MISFSSPICSWRKTVCDIYQMEVRLAVSCPNSEVKYMQKVTLKTQFFGRLHLKLQDTCVQDPNTNLKWAVKTAVP